MFIAGALTLLRIVVLVVSDANLGPDEAQYWFWSTTPDFGYFSKPPLIAWAIGLTTSLFGHEEWAVRLSAPLFHLGAAGFIFATTHKLYNERVAFWVGIAWLTLPGVTLSSFVIATDAPLLFFWSAALYFFFSVLAKKQAGSSAIMSVTLLGITLGLAFLTKYAALYFIVGASLAYAIDPTIRKGFGAKEIAIVVTGMMLIATPNLIWNAQHEFLTVSHTAANANWGSSLLKPASLAQFIGGQFGVFGPIMFSVLAFMLIRQTIPIKISSTQRTLLIFVLTPLIIVTIQSFISRANANWAATAYPAASILVMGWLLSNRHEILAKLSIAVHCLVFIAFSFGVTNFWVAEKTIASKALGKMRAWPEQVQEIAKNADGFDAIVIDDRSLIGEMLYYLRDGQHDIVALDPNARIDTHYEAFKAIDPDTHNHVLFVSTRPDDAHINYQYKQIIPAGSTTVDIGGGHRRTYHLFEADGFIRKKPQRKK